MDESLGRHGEESKRKQNRTTKQIQVLKSAKLRYPALVLEFCASKSIKAESFIFNYSILSNLRHYRIATYIMYL